MNAWGPGKIHPLGHLGMLSGQRPPIFHLTGDGAQYVVDVLSSSAIPGTKLPEKYIALEFAAKMRIGDRGNPEYLDNPELLDTDLRLIAALDVARKWNHVPSDLLVEGLEALITGEGKCTPEQKSLLEALNRTKKWGHKEAEAVAGGIVAARKHFIDQTDEDRRRLLYLDQNR